MTPIPVDTAAQTAITDLLTSIVDGLLGIIPTAVQIAGPFVVTIVVLVFLWALARKFMGR